MSSVLVPTGNFFFRHRNWAFPTLVIGLFAAATPTTELFGSEKAEYVKDCFGVFIAFSGLTLRALVIGRDHVRRAGQANSIHASILLTGGMFSLCRNPLYTGNILIFLGLFLMHGNIWTMLLGSASYIFIYRSIIAAEENYLGQNFGAMYKSYCADVPRWIPNLFRLRQATRGMPLDLRRILLVEYTNIGITIIVLALAEFYQEYEEWSSGASMRRLAVFGSIVIAAALWVGTIRYIKKARLITSR